MLEQKLKNYFNQANKHIELIQEALEILEPILPIKEYNNLTKLQKFALNALIFRFSKLQDLIGAKIFRNYLLYNNFPAESISYFDLLKEIEKEGIIDIDSWAKLRELRNQIAHEYPQDIDETVEKINIFIEKSYTLINTSKKLEQNFHETYRKRKNNNKNNHK